MLEPSQKGAIGLFDSGFGGLTILKEVVKLLPQYDYIYLGDNARAPYGTRSFETVYHYTAQAVEALFKMGSPLVILACNTASAKALRSVQQNELLIWDPTRRVLGVIRPTVELLPKLSKNGHVGVFATKGTVASSSYPLEIAKLHGDKNFKVTQVACPMWVPMVENNELSGEGAEFFVRKYIDELFEQDPEIDTIILGCTHYPLLEPLIKRNLPDGVNIISQGSIVADSLKEYLKRHADIESRLSVGGNITYLTTEQSDYFERIAEIFIGGSLSAVHFDFEEQDG